MKAAGRFFNDRGNRYIVIVLLIAVYLRLWAAALLPEDFDEPVYLQAGFEYARLIAAGDWNGVLNLSSVSEHPALGKLLYGSVIHILGPELSWVDAFYASRILSIGFGVLAVLIAAVGISPLAGGLLAVHTLAIKYTSQVYLEALPMATMLLAILSFVKANQENRKKWFWVSALAVGATAAGKYSYVPVLGVVILYLAVFEKKLPLSWMLGYFLAALGTFWLLDVYLWRDPFNRLYESLFFHINYSQGAHVQQVGYPWYQPFIWLGTSGPASWHPQVFFNLGFDGLISILAALGLPREWKDRRWLVMWLVSGLAFLLAWPTKWPQYALILTPALCITAAATIQQAFAWIREQEGYWGWLEQMVPFPSRTFWIISFTFLFFVASIYLTSAITLIRGRVGWSHLTRDSSLLPSNTVYDILPGPDERIHLATGQGLAVWQPPEASDLPDRWQVFTAQNSILPDNRVLALTSDLAGNLWVGTAAGLVSYDGETWTLFRSRELKLASDQVMALAELDGLLFAGTLSGISAWDGTEWQALAAEPPLDRVFSLLSDSSSGVPVLWVGTSTGVSRLEVRQGTWTHERIGYAVLDLEVDSQGSLWAATSGNGLLRWDGETWTRFRREIPFSTVTAVEEIEPGQLWVASANPAAIGGSLSIFDGTHWKTLTTRNSGFSGAEPLVIVASPQNQVWIGTRSQGIDLFRLEIK